MVKQLSQSKGNVEIGRFKGLGEMTPAQLKETTMTPGKRTLLKVVINEESEELTAVRVEELMGKKPELRYKFITEQSAIMGENLKNKLDI